jgi:chromosome segregation ATPase
LQKQQCATTVKACFMDETTERTHTARSAPVRSNPGLDPFKILAAALALLVILLSAGLWMSYTNAQKQSKELQAKVSLLSSQVQQKDQDLNESKQVNSTLEAHLAQQSEAAKRLSNTLSQTTATLTKTEEEAKKAAQMSAEELAKRDQRISELEGQRDDLTKRMTELNGAITTLEGQIGETQRKLATSEGDRAFLLKELKRLQAEKMELERQFNDLAMLRDQVRKLKEELSTASRLDWLRRGLYGSTPKAEEKLKQPLTSTNKDFNLNVELRQDGSVKVNPGATNAPAPAPPK